MIHSGGYSSRNPNLSATGKIFSPIREIEIEIPTINNKEVDIMYW